MSRIRALIVSAALLVCAWPQTLVAQTPEGGGQSGGGQAGGTGQGGDGENGEGSRLSRPFRGLFGLADDARTGASISGSLFGSYQDNLAATLPGRVYDPRYQHSGWYYGGNGQASMNWRGEKSSLNGWVFGGTSYYPDFKENPFVPSYSAGIGYGRPIGQRNTIRLSQTFQYSPYFLNGFFAEPAPLDDVPVVPVTPDPATDVSGNAILRTMSSGSISRQLSRLSSISVGYSYTHSDYANLDRSYHQHLGSITFFRRLTSHARLHLGYGYRTVTNDLGFLSEDPLQRSMHDINVGVDYNRSFALTMTRRTRVSFSTGSSYVSRSNFDNSNIERARSRLYITGNADLTHEMGRTWRAALTYRRSVGFSELVFEPLVSDSVGASLSGLIGRRYDVTMNASASNGHVGSSTRTDNNFTSYRANAQLRRALTRHLAAFVSYVYYKHDFGNDVVLPITFPHALDRQGVNIGVNVWVPLR